MVYEKDYGVERKVDKYFPEKRVSGQELERILKKKKMKEKPKPKNLRQAFKTKKVLVKRSRSIASANIRFATQLKRSLKGRL